jgi:hypothetical protein
MIETDTRAYSLWESVHLPNIHLVKHIQGTIEHLALWALYSLIPFSQILTVLHRAHRAGC